MALAAKPDETVLVRVEGARMPELLAGRDAVHLGGESVRGLHQLAERLRGLGYAVRTEGSGWLDPKRIVGD